MSLSNQSNHLAGLGRREDALAAIDEAVTIRRGLASTWPVAFAQPLRRSLPARAQLLDSMSKSSEAEVARDEAAHLP